MIRAGDIGLWVGGWEVFWDCGYDMRWVEFEKEGGGRYEMNITTNDSRHEMKQET